MSNVYYTPSGTPATSSQGSSSDIRSEFALIETGLDKLPALTAGFIIQVNTGGTALESVSSVGVSRGGTGATTFTDGGILLGSGTGAITATAALADGEMVVGDGTTDPVLESGATLRTSIGVGTGDSVAFADLTLTTDLSVANGGTGTSTLTDGGVLLGSGSGAITAMGVLANSEMIVGDGTTDPVAESGATLRTSIGVGTADNVTFADITGDAATFASLALTTDLPVSQGGTGVSSLTDGGTLIGSGTGGITVLAQATNGQIVIGSTGLDPVLAALTAGSGIVINNTAGAIEIVATAAGGTVTNIATAGTENGLTLTGGPITTTGTITLGGTLAINDSDWSGTDLSVANGGTGVSTLTDGGVLLGSGTGGITATAVLTNGQMIVGDGTTDPVLESGATLRTSIGVGTGDSPTFAGLTLTADLTVANGGTGASTLTDGGFLLGSGTGAITALAQGTDGQLAICDTGGDPILATLTAGSGIEINNAAGSIEIVSTAGGGTITNIATAGTENGLTLTGGPITTTGTITLGGTLSINNGDWSGTDLSVANGGTGASTLTDGGTLIGSGTGAITALGQGTNGQIVIGSTGLDPVLTTITAGSGIQINNTAGAIEVVSLAGGGTVTSILTAGTVNGMTLTGGEITTTGTVTLGGTLAINNSDWSGTDLSVANGGTGVSTLTDGGTLIGSGTGAITALAQATNGQIVIGSTGVDPVLSTITAGSGIQINNTAGGIEVVSTAGGGTVTSILTAGTVNGLTLTGGEITTTGTITLGGTLAINNSDWSGTDLAVGNGGTGVSTLTNGGILLGSGTSGITALAVLADGEMIVGDGTTDPSIESGATLRTSIGVGTGDSLSVNDLTLSLDLSVPNGGTGVSSFTDGGILVGSGTGDITALSVMTNGQMIVGDGVGDPVLESGATLRTSIGVGTGDSVTFNALTLTTDLTVANGGTGASSLTAGGILLGSGTAAITPMAVLADGEMIVGDGVGDPVAESGATLRTSIGLGTLAEQNTVNNSDWSGTDLAVANGGTGVSTLTDGGILLGSGTGAVTATAVLGNGEMIVGDGTTDPAIESGATLRTSIGLGSLAEQNTVNNGDWSGTDLAVGNGGTGVSSLTNGGVLLGSGTGGITAMAVLANSAMIVGDGSADPVAESGATLRTSIGVGTSNNVSFAGITAGGSVSVNGTTDSTSTTTGSLQTDGGLGVVKNIHCNGSLINTHTSDTVTRVGVGAADITTGTNNSAFGHDALGSNVGGINNSAFGFEALKANTGTGNTAFGLAALGGNIGGSSNVGVGWGAGEDITTGSNLIAIGAFALAGSTGANNRIVIGDGISGTADNQFSLGKVSNVVSNDFGTDAVWTRSSDERRKQEVNPLGLGLSFINDLEPVTYKWKSADQYPKEWGIDPKTEIDTDTIMTGMLAQKVKEALDNADTGIRFPGWQEQKNGMQQIAGEAFIFPLINAINELTARLKVLEGK